MSNAWALLLVACLGFSGCATGRNGDAGTRIEATEVLQLNRNTTEQSAEVFLPKGFRPLSGDSLTLLLHLHGAPRAAEVSVREASSDAVLCALHLGKLSSPYREYFSDTTALARILESVRAALREADGLATPRIRRLVVTSFSAGYAGVRELLKRPESYRMIDAVVLADGLHADTDSATMAMQMRDFCRYALDACAGRKAMLITHSCIPTSGYESTTSTANYLLRGIGVERRAVSLTDEIGHRTSECDSGLFRLRGYDGETGADHMKHLHALHLLVSETLELLDQRSAAVTRRTDPGGK